MALSEDLRVTWMLTGLWCIGQLFQTGFDLHQRLPARRSPGHGASALPSFSGHALSAGTRATGCSEIQGLPCSHCCGEVQHFHKVPKESVSTSPSLNQKPQKAGQAEGAHSQPVLSCCALQLCIPPKWDKIPYYFPALLGFHVPVMAFATHLAGEKVWAREAVLGLVIAVTKVLKSCLCMVK